MLPYRRDLKPNARALRSWMTDAEQKLWHRLRCKQINGWQFYRQKPIGSYIVDFYCPAARLVVELDGSQHLEPEHRAADQERDAFLVAQGLRVLRFDNRQALMETDAVVGVIAQTQIPPGPPFSKGGVKPAHELPPSPQLTPTPIPPFEASQRPPFPPFEKGGLGGICSHPARETKA